MQNRKNNTSMGQMIQRCHRWRQKRKGFIDQARQTSDEIERERLLQMAEHYGRIVNDEQGKIDSTRGPGDKGRPERIEQIDIAPDDTEDEDMEFSDFMTQIK